MAKCYLDSEHAAKVQAFAAQVTQLKTQKANYLGRTQIKNQLIMRHYYNRLMEISGPYDGRGAANNYTKSGMPRKLKRGGPETSWDVHVLAWQLELVKDQLLLREEVLSPASVGMLTNWALTQQVAKNRSTSHSIAWWRRPAIHAGWLLLRDQLALEEKNFPPDFTFEEFDDIIISNLE